MRTVDITEHDLAGDLEAIALGERERRALKTFLTRLQRGLGENLVRVILFGSKARGAAKRGSDIDLLVIVQRRNMGDSHEVYKAASRTDLQYRVDISPKIFSLEEYEQHREIGALFVEEVEKEGVILI